MEDQANRGYIIEDPAEKNDRGKTALITGASRGIGRAAAIRFAREGYDLVLSCAHSMEELKRLSLELRQDYGIRCIPARADMSSYEEVQRLFRNFYGTQEENVLSDHRPKICSGGICPSGKTGTEFPAPRFRGPDVLVNNAGISYIGLLSEMTPEEWQKVIATNLDSCFYTCKLAIPLMLKEHKGRIINISSVWGNTGASMEVAYSASKGAVNAFTKALAKELAPSNIQVNAIACGLIDTNMNSGLSREDLEALREEIPADRIGTPEEVAELILQLAQSPAYLTGQVIAIDGGWR